MDLSSDREMEGTDSGLGSVDKTNLNEQIPDLVPDSDSSSDMLSDVETEVGPSSKSSFKIYLEKKCLSVLCSVY